MDVRRMLQVRYPKLQSMTDSRHRKTIPHLQMAITFHYHLGVLLIYLGEQSFKMLWTE